MLLKGAGTKGRLEGCDLAANEGGGLWVCEGACPLVLSSKCVLSLFPPPPTQKKTRIF